MIRYGYFNLLSLGYLFGMFLSYFIGIRTYDQLFDQAFALSGFLVAISIISFIAALLGRKEL